MSRWESFCWGRINGCIGIVNRQTYMERDNRWRHGKLLKRRGFGWECRPRSDCYCFCFFTGNSRQLIYGAALGKKKSRIDPALGVVVYPPVLSWLMRRCTDVQNRPNCNLISWLGILWTCLLFFKHQTLSRGGGGFSLQNKVINQTYSRKFFHFFNCLLIIPSLTLYISGLITTDSLNIEWVISYSSSTYYYYYYYITILFILLHVWSSSSSSSLSLSSSAS